MTKSAFSGNVPRLTVTAPEPGCKAICKGEPAVAATAAGYTALTKTEFFGAAANDNVKNLNFNDINLIISYVRSKQGRNPLGRL